MNKENMLNYLLAACSVLFFILAFSNLAEIPSDLQNVTKTNTKSQQLTPGELDKIDKVLQKKINSVTFAYTGQFESPFRTRSTNIVISKSPKDTLLKRTKLFLKGILTTNAPLAILEDEKGETYIRGTGEKALDQEIIKISDSKVILRDGHGTYELTVQEQ